MSFFSLSTIASISLLASFGRVAAQQAFVGGGCLITGFNNETFGFQGLPGHSYRVLAAADLAVNVELVPAGPGQDGHFIGGISALQDSFELYAHTDAAGNMSIILNGLELDIELPVAFNQRLISYEPYKSGFGQVVTIRTKGLHLAIIAVKQFSNEAGAQVRGHFDLHAKVVDASLTAAEGMLGETLGQARPGQAGTEAPRDAGPYEVTSLSDKARAAAATAADIAATAADTAATAAAMTSTQMSAARHLLAA